MKNRLLWNLIAVVLSATACAQEKTRLPGSSLSDPEFRRDLGQIPNDELCKIRFKKTNVCLSWKWEQLPTRTQKGSITFWTYTDTSETVPFEFEFLPQLVLWMPSMGHGSTPTVVSRLGAGKYLAQDVYFVMRGKWELRFEVKNPTDPQLPVFDEAVVEIVID